MLDHFVLGAREVANIEIEKIYLEDIPIENYRYANRSGAGEHEVEFAKLCHQISGEIDGLVLATPTYNFSVPAHLKNFIDRSRCFALDFSQKTALGQPVGRLGHIRTYFLVSGGIPNWSQKILFFAFPPFWLRGLFLYMGAKVLGAYYSGDVETFKNDRILKKCRKKGKKFALQVLQGRGNGILENIFWRPPEVE